MSPADRPLGGLTVLLTRDGGLAEELRALGATVRVAELVRYERIEAEPGFEAYDWIVFTSARAVAYSGFRPVEGPRIACVGPRTAFAVVERGGMVHFRPAEHRASALAEELLAAERMDGSRVLFPCSDRALTTVEDRLRAGGAEVVRLTVYRTVTADVLPEGAAGNADAVVFLAPSAVEAWAGLGGDLFGVPALAIGPTTAAALRERGASPRVAPTADRDGIIEALGAWETD